MAKLVLTMGMNLGDRNLAPHQDEVTRQKTLEVAGTILRDVLKVLSELNISLEQVSLRHLNSLIGHLGEHGDHQTLSWLLKLLWNSRDAQRNWDPATTFVLARRFIMARYLVGDTSDALSLAEDMVYNSWRVYVSTHASTLEMSVLLLTQLYTGIAQRYQRLAAGQAMANRYYKKSAAIHENILRAFSDPSYAGVDGGLESRRCSAGATAHDMGGIAQHGGVARPLDEAYYNNSNNAGDLHRRLDAPPQFPGSAMAGLSDGQHLQYFKLALERLGSWPKEYSEYESLNGDLFRMFGLELHDVRDMERWDLNTYGMGKAENDDDILDSDFKN
jgi:hypothetical protein